MLLRPQLSSTPSAPFFSDTPPLNPNRDNLSPSSTSSHRRLSSSRSLEGFTPLRTVTPSLFPSSSSVSTSDSGLLFRQKLLYLENQLGVDSSTALSHNPNLRSASISSLHSVAACFRSFGISRPSDVGRILAMYPHLLTCDPSTQILPVLRFLVDTVDIPLPDGVRKAVLRCPRLLVSSVSDQLLPTLYFLRRLGFVGSHSITCQTTLLLVSSVEATLIPKLDFIQSLGFSYKDTVKMILRSPGLFTFSIENNFRPKVAFLVREMGRDINELKDFPQYFSFSLEKKIKPRHRLLVEHGFSLPLADMLKVSDGEFNDGLVEMRLKSIEGKR